eukprot:COSAG01_NODE_1305_length_10807_cov_3.074897_12_plen_68_part_00
MLALAAGRWAGEGGLCRPLELELQGRDRRRDRVLCCCCAAPVTSRAIETLVTDILFWAAKALASRYM